MSETPNDGTCAPWTEAPPGPKLDRKCPAASVSESAAAAPTSNALGVGGARIDTALAAYAYLGLVAAMFVHLRPPRQPQPLLAPLMRQLRWAGGDAAKNDS